MQNSMSEGFVVSQPSYIRYIIKTLKHLYNYRRRVRLQHQFTSCAVNAPSFFSSPRHRFSLSREILWNSKRLCEAKEKNGGRERERERIFSHNNMTINSSLFSLLLLSFAHSLVFVLRSSQRTINVMNCYIKQWAFQWWWRKTQINCECRTGRRVYFDLIFSHSIPLSLSLSLLLTYIAFTRRHECCAEMLAIVIATAAAASPIIIVVVVVFLFILLNSSSSITEGSSSSSMCT